MRNKIIIGVIALIMLTSFVNAAQDSYITIDSKGSGLCLSVDGLGKSYCNNETMAVDGTNDHLLYIQPETKINEGSNITAKMNYIIFTPISVIISGFFMWIIFMFVIFIALAVMLTKGIIKI